MIKLSHCVFLWVVFSVSFFISGFVYGYILPHPDREHNELRFLWNFTSYKGRGQDKYEYEKFKKNEFNKLRNLAYEASFDKWNRKALILITDVETYILKQDGFDYVGALCKP